MAISSEDAVILRQAVERQLADLESQVSELQSVLQRLNGAGRRRPQTQKAAEPAPVKERTRRRRKMTAAQRKAIGERMRKYWAGRKQARGAKAKA